MHVMLHEHYLFALQQTYLLCIPISAASFGSMSGSYMIQRVAHLPEVL